LAINVTESSVTPLHDAAPRGNASALPDRHNFTSRSAQAEFRSPHTEPSISADAPDDQRYGLTAQFSALLIRSG